MPITPGCTLESQVTWIFPDIFSLSHCLTGPHSTQGESVLDPTVIKELKSESYWGVGAGGMNQSELPPRCLLV